MGRCESRCFASLGAGRPICAPLAACAGRRHTPVRATVWWVAQGGRLTDCSACLPALARARARILPMPESICFHSFPVAGVDAMRACSIRSFPRHTHDHYGIGVIDAGAQAWWSGRGHVQAAAGSVISQNPGEVHDGAPVGGRSRSWRMLYLDTTLIDRLWADTTLGSPHEFTFAAPAFADPAVRHRFDIAFALSEAVPVGDSALVAETALVTLLGSLGSHAARVALTLPRAAVCISAIRQRIDADPARPWTLADLVANAGISRYQLIRAFARETGLTPHAYIVQGRIAIARRLLRANRHVADVAVHAGFCDQSHLTRCFVRHMGVTPHRYAQRSA